MSIHKIAIQHLSAHPKNPRIEPRQEVVDQIAAQIQSKGTFDESHALIVRAVDSGYQIISGHHRWLAAKQAGLTEIPCWVRELTDDQSYMELVLCNTQSELHPLEEGKHAAESGKSGSEYAKQVGQSQPAVALKIMAFRVWSAITCVITPQQAKDSWRNLAEVHAAPNWLWSALVKAMAETNWTVQTTREKVGALKDIAEPPKWADWEKVAEAVITGQMRISEVAKLQKLVDDAKVSGEFRLHLQTAIESALPSMISEVQAIVSHWEWQQANAEEIERQEVLARQRASEDARQFILSMRKNTSLEDWNKLSQTERDEIIIPIPGEGGSFNKQDNADIEWAQWSWNPVTGCKHNCSYCYARDIALSSKMKPYYPNGFEPTFRSNALNAPRNTKVPEKAATDARFKNVFTCSMADLFGRWVPQEWIDAVMLSVKGSPQWDFLFLTKFPQRLAEIEIPENAWMGTTVDLQARVANAERAFEKVQCRVKWLSVEPMIEPLRFERLDLFDWIVIGGASPSSETPKWEPPFEWIDDLVAQCREAGTKIYMKSNLGIANRILELPLDLPIIGDPKRAPDSFFYLGNKQ